MLAAIEIYNKPLFEYRDEVFVILLLNAWELLLKAVLSKNRISIYEKKQPKQTSRTINLREALKRSLDRKVWPSDIDVRPVQANLEQIKNYRDTAVHFYNDPNFGVIVYSLALPSILNFRLVLHEVFNKDFADEIKWRLLPLGIEPPFDPVVYLKGPRPGKRVTEANKFLENLGEVTGSLDTDGVDTSRFIIPYSVAIESIKKTEKADAVVAVNAAAGGSVPFFLGHKMIDPRESHPFRMRNVLEQVGVLHGRKFNKYDFLAVVHQHNFRSKKQWCYTDGNSVRWSKSLLAFMQKLDESEIKAARDAYGRHVARKAYVTRKKLAHHKRVTDAP